MKRTLILLTILCPFLIAAQPKIKDKKYQGLLWEITGNGLKKPSYLFGTMHVSNKLAFQLADSFYLGIRNADIVALETNPESWQEDMSNYQLDQGGYDNYRGGYFSVPDDYLTINTLKFYKYDKQIERSLYSNPSVINNLLYRSNDNSAADFEEDTYLDMYIYQCGKKWGKKVAGVERYAESMKLMAEAYKDAAKDKNRKNRSYDRENFSGDKLQEAYRTGNLDLLDSINKYNSVSAAFDEKFLYKRNEIQAGSIDSILKTRQSLFVGVGAAHLPGNRGVIEMLRAMGYKMRPVKMGARDSQHKSTVEKIRVPVTFTTQTASDGLYKVDIPGKFYKFGEAGALDQYQYADMANGSYYMVTRIMTNSWMWGHSTDDVYHIIDSLLYENIPGKITSKTAIVKNGYRGFAITNKTRRGDVQRYNILVTPFEILFFKMSGNGDYVTNGPEADRFFNSIQIHEYKSATGSWVKYSPPYGGFSVDLPYEPYIGNDGSWIYDADDRSTNTQYRVIRSDVHNYNFIEEDTFDLGLMQESFTASEFIDTMISRQITSYKGYPALDCKFLGKDKSVFLTRFLIQGPHYFTLIAHAKQENPKMQGFLNSFEIKPIVYPETIERRDTSLYFAVKSPVFPDEKKNKIDVPRMEYGYDDGEEDESESDQLLNGVFRNKIISNDTTGEKIFVSFYKMQRYYMSPDSTLLESDNDGGLFGDTTLITRMKKKYELPGKMKVWERIVSDTGSSRAIWTKTFYKNGIGFSLATQVDTLTPPSAFLKNFYDTFTPADTLDGANPFVKKTKIFFEDFASKDSVVHKRAVRNIYQLNVDSTDFIPLRNAIISLNWNEKKYLDTKKALIDKLVEVKSKPSADFLKNLYYAAGDTLELQYAALEALLGQETSYSYNVFKDIVTDEPPVLGIENNNDYAVDVPSYENYRYNSPGGNFLRKLRDSIKLTRTILPDLLPLMNLDDYERPMMRLLALMVDSSLASPKDYQPYFSKFLIEAKQELKKQAIAEKSKAIRKAEDDKAEQNDSYRDSNDDKDRGNANLSLYATLLVPFYEANAAVPSLFNQLLQSNDKELKYSTMLLMIRNGKSVPDSLPQYFGSLDEYRFELYSDLKKMKKLARFPAAYNNHLALSKSKIFTAKYQKPDSIQYVDRLPAVIKGHKGFVYFYKYKEKKDDLDWKLATVGLVPSDSTKFEFDHILPRARQDEYARDQYRMTDRYRFDFTDFSDTKLRDDEPVDGQLAKLLKRMIYSKRKSARGFYQQDRSGSYDYEQVSLGD